MRSDVSLWIPTLNSEATLTGTLAAVRSLDPEPVSVRIIDGGSSDDTHQIAERFGISAVPQGESIGLAGARNIALNRTETKYIAFIDSDVRPVPNWLDTLSTELEQENVAAATAPIKQYPRTASERWSVRRLSFHEPNEPGTTHRIPGANGIYETNVLRDIGGWDPENFPMGGEDVYLSRQLRRHHSLRFNSDTFVIHTPHAGLDAVTQLWEWHTQGDGPESLPELGYRIIRHLGKSGKYSIEDIYENDISSIPWSLAVAPVHIGKDLSCFHRRWIVGTD